jgi:hypothetical protein
MPISSEFLSRRRSVRACFAWICGVLGIVVLTLGFVLAYASRALFNSGAFADRMAASLNDPGVAGLIAGRVTEALIAEERDLTPFGPLIAGTTRQLVASEPFRGIVRRAARVGHEAMMSGRGERFLLNLADVGVILRSALATHPELAKKIPLRFTALVGDSAEAPGGRIAVDFARAARRSRLSALALIIFGLGGVVLGIGLSPARRKTLSRLGLGLAVIALVLRLTVRFGGEILAQFARDPSVGQAVAGLWRAFFGGFMTWALMLAGIGLVLVAAVHSLFELVKWDELGRSAWRRLSAPPTSTGARLLRGVGLLLVGGFISLAPGAAWMIVAFLAGLVVIFVGLGELFGLLLRTFPEWEPRKAGRSAAREGRGFLRTRAVLVGAVACVLVGLGVLALIRRAETASTPRTIVACNGLPELCDRRLDEVVFPATHNSMSGADIPDWLFPSQEKGIPGQLNDGVRALLIDAHLGVPVGGKVKTLLENEEAAREKYEAVLGKEGIEAAMRIRDRLVGREEGERGVYLCHGFCELGASAIVPVLEQVREFLVVNPDEVLIIVIQDEGVTPQDLEKCFLESGLADFVYRGAAARPWPTLREMVATDQRVVVMTENDASRSVSWIHPVSEAIQETPYSFPSQEEFSCAPNRGGTSGSLFLLNHWIDTPPAPLPSNAEVANAYDFLLTRARGCMKERRHLPNLIAVDFYLTGDLFEVAKTLNRMPRPKLHQENSPLISERTSSARLSD